MIHAFNERGERVRFAIYDSDFTINDDDPCAEERFLEQVLRHSNRANAELRGCVVHLQRRLTASA